jgi:hypothetical protein
MKHLLSIFASINGNKGKYGYWRTTGDGIYSNFVKTFPPQPTTWMQKMFALAQEAKQKDIKQAFGTICQAYLLSYSDKQMLPLHLTCNKTHDYQ